jgi:hypothetical protein
MSSIKARPLRTEKEYHIEKILVLSHLLDCAVQAPDKQQRRTYIGRIMTLKKSTQKTIMAMIEARSSSNKNNSPTKGVKLKAESISQLPSSTASPSKSSGSSKQSVYQANNVSSSVPAVKQKQVLGGLFSSPSPFQSTKETTEAVISRMNCAAVGNSSSKMEPLMYTPPIKKQSESTPLKSSLRKSSETSSSNRGYSVAFGDPLAKSPNTPIRTDLETSNIPGFLSPGTLESPSRMQSIVTCLHHQNEALQQKLESLQNRDVEMNRKCEHIEVVHRQKMMTMESQSLERIQDLARESEERITELKAQLLEAQELSSQGSFAMQELKAAKEELEVMNHSKAALAETTEKLRKFKDKVTELQDVKEALRKEQESHGQSVDEVIRLENELQQLQPLKRQVEDYRIRAIEAEVKLVECQDYLRRKERQCKDQTTQNDHLYQDVIMQKEHMDELQRRIQEDTQRPMETAISGIGEGVSELNPELKEELVRLRNENLQLRAFQAKRTEDAVQYLEESLDDAKRLAERYKDEFLRTKDNLGSTHASLQESLQREDSLRLEVNQWNDRCRELEQRCESLVGQLDFSEKLLNETKKFLEESENQNSGLRADIKDLMLKHQESDKHSKEKLQQLILKLEETEKAFGATQDEVKRLLMEAEGMHVSATKNSEHLRQVETSLEKITWEFEESRTKLTQKLDETQMLQSRNTSLQKQIGGMEEKIRVERHQRKEEAREAQQSLETTRQLLEIKSKKELDELQGNMARLLDDERKANRKKDEDSKRIVAQMEHQWQQKYVELQERSTSALQLSRQQAHEQVDLIQQENKCDIERLNQDWVDDVAKIRKESNETLENFIRKGKEKVKVMQSKVQEEMQRLDDERRDIEEKYDRLEKKSAENECSLQDRITSLKQQLEFVTSQINDRVREAEEQIDLIKTLDREKFKLNEENEQYRRQLGGRYANDGHIQSQLEKLQKEYCTVVEENRNLKRVQHRNDHVLGSATEIGEEEGSNRTYRRGSGVDRRALTQLQKDFEERVDLLNNEKRDLIMKMSSQSTDVHKAERRAWESEEENVRLKAENTSLKLRLERIEFSDDIASNRSVNENRSPMGSSFHSTHQSTSSPSPSKTDGAGLVSRSSPGIDRAKKQKLVQENNLRSRFSSITGTPPRAGHQQGSGQKEAGPGSVLSASQNIRHCPSSDAGSDIPEVPPRAPSPTKFSKPSPRTPSKISKMASDVFRLGLTNGTPRSPQDNSNDAASGPLQPHQVPSPVHPYAQMNDQLDENHQECKQS